MRKNKKKDKKKKPSLKVLALDIATKTGWATDTAAGVWNCAAQRDESKGMVLIRLKAKLREIIKAEGIELVVFEMASGRFKGPLIAEAEKIGVCKSLLEENGIDYKGYPTKKIKSFATGNGNASKALMVKFAEEKYSDKYGEIIDDNMADAIHLYYLALDDLKLI